MYFAPAASPAFPAAYPTVYAVTCLPEHIPDASTWTLTVEHRGKGRWTVKHGTDYLGRDGTWGHDKPHLVPLDEALELAKAAAPSVVRAGMTPADVLAWHAAGRPTPIPRPHTRTHAAQAAEED